MSLATAERHKLELDEVQSELATLHDSMNCVASEIALDLGMYEAKYNMEKETVEDHKQQLEILMRCNALNDLFNVWFDGSHITVNGMRIGRVGNQVLTRICCYVAGLGGSQRSAGRPGTCCGCHAHPLPMLLSQRRDQSSREFQ